MTTIEEITEETQPWTEESGYYIHWTGEKKKIPYWSHSTEIHKETGETIHTWDDGYRLVTDSQGRLLYRSRPGNLEEIVRYSGDRMVRKEEGNIMEWWKLEEWDEKGNPTHYSSREGRENIEWWKEYDGDRMVRHGIKVPGLKVVDWKEYDEKGKVIRAKKIKTDGVLVSETHFDEKGNQTYYRPFPGMETWTEYDERGNKIHLRNSNGRETWVEYDEHNHWTHLREDDGLEKWQAYDEKGNNIFYYDTEGNETLIEYDERGIETYRLHFPSFAEWWRDDDLGLFYFHDGHGNETWREGDIDGKLIIRFLSNGKSSTREARDRKPTLKEREKDPWYQD